MQINEQRAQSTIARVSGGYFDSTTEELEEALLYIKQGHNQLPYDPKAPKLIELELEKRNRHENIAISKKVLNWQKIAVGISIVILIITILIYFKP